MLGNSIIDALSKGSIKPVLLFSDTDIMPSPPYVVVKPETGAIPGTRQYRIIVHHRQGFADDLEKYTLGELDELLPGLIKDDDGKCYLLRKGGYTDITPEGDDNTFFMERIYYTPLPGMGG